MREISTFRCQITRGEGNQAEKWGAGSFDSNLLEVQFSCGAPKTSLESSFFKLLEMLLQMYIIEAVKSQCKTLVLWYASLFMKIKDSRRFDWSTGRELDGRTCAPELISRKNKTLKILEGTEGATLANIFSSTRGYLAQWRWPPLYNTMINSSPAYLRKKITLVTTV